MQSEGYGRDGLILGNMIQIFLFHVEVSNLHWQTVVRNLVILLPHHLDLKFLVIIITLAVVASVLFCASPL